MKNNDDPLIPLTPEERRKQISEIMQMLDRDESQARAEFESKMQLIERRRMLMEAAWRSTYAD